MKKLQIFLALGVTIPFIIVAILHIQKFGIFTGRLPENMGLGDAFLTIFLALPVATICFCIFISRIIYLQTKNRLTKQEFVYFIKTLFIFGIITIIFWILAGIST